MKLKDEAERFEAIRGLVGVAQQMIDIGAADMILRNDNGDGIWYAPVLAHAERAVWNNELPVIANYKAMIGYILSMVLEVRTRA